MKKPQGVEIRQSKGEIYVKGPKGIKKARVAGVTIVGDELKVADRATRGVLKQMIEGVKTGYKQKIKIHGVGYRAQIKGEGVEVSLGYKEPKEVRIRDTVTIAIGGNGTIIEGRSTSWSELRQNLSKIVELRPASKDPYKGKGVIKWKK